MEEYHNKKLLVEGPDDKHVVTALRDKLKLPENFDVIPMGGLPEMCEQLPTRLKQSDTEVLGIVIDADTDIANNWAKVKGRLSKKINKLPKIFPTNGLIIQGDDIKIGVWIMPNNNANGILEDFIKFLVPNEDELFKRVDKYISEIEKDKLHKYKTDDRPKALMHSWLALQKSPRQPLGIAILKRYLSNFNAPECQQFKQWLNDLFNS